MTPSADGTPAAPPITVLLVDPHATIRAALASALSAEPGIAVVAAVGTSLEALAMVRRHRPRVTLVDIAVFGHRGVTGLGELRLTHDMAILGLALVEGDGMRRALVRHGADGSVLKDAPPGELAGAIRNAAAHARALRLVPPEA